MSSTVASRITPRHALIDLNGKIVVVTGGAAGIGEAIAFRLQEAGAVERLVASTIERFGHIDILVNNAGISLQAPFLDMPAALFVVAGGRLLG